MESFGHVAANWEAASVTPELHMYSLIGTHIKEQGLLDADQVEMILSSQQLSGLRFGDEAIRLGLLTQDQIDLALPRQLNANKVLVGNSAISTDIVAAYRPDCPSISPIRSLRTILVSQHIRKNAGGYTLAITSAHRKDGRSVIVANLAVLFSQIGMSTLVVDADLRSSRQHDIFGLTATHGLSSVLARHSLANMIQKIDGLGPLAVLPAGARPPSPEQLLNRRIFPAILAELKKQFDVLILDTPSTEDNDDALVIAERAANTIVLAHKNKTRSHDLARLMAGLNAVKTNVIGTILRAE
jgi:protein-tyrosine kinase